MIPHVRDLAIEESGQTWCPQIRIDELQRVFLTVGRHLMCGNFGCSYFTRLEPGAAPHMSTPDRVLAHDRYNTRNASWPPDPSRAHSPRTLPRSHNLDTVDSFERSLDRTSRYFNLQEQKHTRAYWLIGFIKKREETEVTSHVYDCIDVSRTIKVGYHNKVQMLTQQQYK